MLKRAQYTKLAGQTEIRWRLVSEIVDDRRGLTHGGRGDEEATADATDGETDELSAHGDEPLVAEVPGRVVVDPLDGDDVGGIGGVGANGSHDGDEHMSIRDRSKPPV